MPLDPIIHISGWDIAKRGNLICFFDPRTKYRVVVRIDMIQTYWCSDDAVDSGRSTIFFVVMVPKTKEEAKIYVPVMREHADRVMEIVDEKINSVWFPRKDTPHAPN